VKGDIDFDNIDNVIRAGSSMGIIGSKQFVHPYEVIDALALENDEVRIRPEHFIAISLWKAARRSLYGSINSNPHEFRAQTAIKWAIEDCALEDDSLTTPGAWRLTEPVLMFEHLRQKPFSKMLVDRVRLGKPPELLFTAWVEDLTPFFGKQSRQTISDLCDGISQLTNMEVYVNYYLDKRERAIHMRSTEYRSLLSVDSPPEPASDMSNAHQRPSGIVGMIGVSRIERYRHQSVQSDQSLLSRNPLDHSKAISLLENVLKQKLLAFSSGWVDTRLRQDQMSLFASP
jgi:hypothetical protein